MIRASCLVAFTAALSALPFAAEDAPKSYPTKAVVRRPHIGPPVRIGLVADLTPYEQAVAVTAVGVVRRVSATAGDEVAAGGQLAEIDRDGPDFEDAVTRAIKDASKRAEQADESAARWDDEAKEARGVTAVYLMRRRQAVANASAARRDAEGLREWVKTLEAAKKAAAHRGRPEKVAAPIAGKLEIAPRAGELVWPDRPAWKVQSDDRRLATIAVEDKADADRIERALRANGPLKLTDDIRVVTLLARDRTGRATVTGYVRRDKRTAGAQIETAIEIVPPSLELAVPESALVNQKGGRSWSSRRPPVTKLDPCPSSVRAAGRPTFLPAINSPRAKRSSSRGRSTSSGNDGETGRPVSRPRIAPRRRRRGCRG